MRSCRRVGHVPRKDYHSIIKDNFSLDDCFENLSTVTFGCTCEIVSISHFMLFCLILKSKPLYENDLIVSLFLAFCPSDIQNYSFTIYIILLFIIFVTTLQQFKTSTPVYTWVVDSVTSI